MDLIFTTENPAQIQDQTQVHLINFSKDSDSTSLPLQIEFKNMDKITIISSNEQFEKSWNNLISP